MEFCAEGSIIYMESAAEVFIYMWSSPLRKCIIIGDSPGAG